MNTHILNVRVYYEDTDAGGIVYHTSYLRFAERGRTEMLRDIGFEHAALLRDEGTAFAVKNMQVDYMAPARLDDLLAVKTSVTEVGGASLSMTQDICLGEDILVRILLRLACINTSGKAIRLPKDLIESLPKI